MQQGLSKAASATAAKRNTSQQTPLRFEVGDRVEVLYAGPDLPRNRRGKAKVKNEWYQAIVTQLWYWEDGMSEPAPYQCKLDLHQGKVFVPKDTDESITRAGQPPHDRLLEAIQQHCNPQHLQFIVQRHGLDVKVFGDELIKAAASACCFCAFSWLVAQYNVNANQCKGPKDRNVLHLAVMGRSPAGKPGPEEFFREIFSWDYTNRTMFDLRHLLVQQDADDQTILHLAALVGKTHPRLMEVLLDPHLEGGRIFTNRNIMKHNLTTYIDSKGRTAKDICVRIKNDLGAQILDQFGFWLALYRWSHEIYYSGCLKESEFVLSVVFEDLFSQFGDMETLKSYASQGFFAHSFSETISRLVFRFLQGALVDPLVFLSDSLGVDIRNYHFEEYIFKSAPDMLDKKKGDDTSSSWRCQHLGTIENAVISEWDGFDGIVDFFLKWRGDEEVMRYGNHARGEPWELPWPLFSSHWQWKIMQVTDDTEFVKKALKRVDNLAVLEAYEKSKFCKWREDPPLSRRRDMLNWLVQSKGQCICPHLFVLHQQPSLLRWACDLHYFDLDSPMGEFTSLLEHIRTLDWLPFKLPGRNKSKAPKKPALKDSKDSEYFRVCSDLGDILLFLSAGYGDILAFEYLLMKRSPQHSLSSLCSIAYAGQPLLHVAARRGSAEIVKLLVARELVQVDSFFEGVNAAHVAFSSGFRFIGQFLLNSGCSAVDLQGRDHLWHARISGLKHMTSYVEREESNARLQRCNSDIDQLFVLFRESNTSFDIIKTYIETCPTFTALESPVTLDTRYPELLPLVIAHSVEATAYFLKLIKIGDPCYYGGIRGPAIFDLVAIFADIFPERERESDGDGFNPRGMESTFADIFPERERESDGDGFNPRGMESFLANRYGVISARHLWRKFVLFQAQRMGKQDVVHYLSSIAHEKEKGKLFRKVVLHQQGLLEEGAEVVYIKENVSKLIDLNMPNYKDWELSIIDQTGNLNRKTIDEFTLSKPEQPCLRGLFLVCCTEGYLQLVEWLLVLDAVEGKKLQEGFEAAVKGGNLSVVSYLWDSCGSKILDSTISSALSYAGERGDLAQVQALLQHLLDRNGDPNIASSHKFAGEARRECACNVLTAAILYYVGHSQRIVVEASLDECVVDLRLLEEDFEGQDRIQLLQFLMTQKTIDPTKVMWNRLLDSLNGSLNRLDLFGELRLANAVRILCARDQGSSARKLFENLLEKFGDDWRLHQVLNLPVLTIFAEQHNIDIQESTQPKIKAMLEGLSVDRLHAHNWNRASLAELQQLAKRQRIRWQWIDQIHSVVSLQKLQTDAQDAGIGSQLPMIKNRHGKTALHMAAACNRKDVVEWLVCDMRMDPSSVDEDGKSALQLAQAAGSDTVQRFLRRHHAQKVMARFAQSAFRMRKQRIAFRCTVSAARAIQSRYRSWQVFRTTRSLVRSRLVQRQSFMAVWGPLVQPLANLLASSPHAPLCWVSLKNASFDFSRLFQEDDEDETSQVVLDATKSAAKDISDASAGILPDVEDADSPSGAAPDPNCNDRDVCNEEGSTEVAEMSSSALEFENIKLTAEALKWYKHADPRLSMLFLRRLEQLAAGDRSRILNKHLVGSKNFSIFETYLDQGRTALRILWTEVRERNGLRGILVWYVSKHKHVSKYMAQIDEASMRLNRQLSSARSLFEGDEADVLLLDGDTVLLDPMSNTPLKIHEADVRQLASKELLDSLPLRLTEAEKSVIGKSGSVLVLGRSGTGKTICIANKMTYDARTRSREGRQLFVCRSARVCALVSRLQHHVVEKETRSSQGSNAPVFMQLEQLISLHLRDAPTAGQFAANGRRVTYRRFVTEFFGKTKVRRGSSLHALVVWTQIQSFIKGSIEAVMLKRSLLLDEYLQLGEDRVRLSTGQRRDAFAVFQLYTDFCEEKRLWDDADRVLNLISHLKRREVGAEEEEEEREGNGAGGEHGQDAAADGQEAQAHNSYWKIYVDECQDLTQAEIALLFMLSQSRSLFLAGDTAQSVLEGVTFRFSEVRSVAYHLGVSVPEKPTILHLNFRSHSGILDLARTVLTKLFAHFPGAASKLPPDEGLYKGPRPGLLVVSEEKLVESLGMNEGLVILTHEHNTERLQQLFGAQRIVLGIREAKGLEFPDVAVVDFFSSMTREDQLRWREMMVMDEDELQESGQRRGVDLRYKFPELETQLKLLYTAITRSERSLYLIETKRSVAGAAFFAHVRDRGLAQVQELLSSDAVLLTHDEWVSRGLDFAMAAKETAHIEDELTWLRRAIQCFDCADNAEMRRRARAHWASALLRKKLLESASKDQALEADAEADVEAEFTVELEMEAMRVIRGCITSSMLREAVEVCQVVLPLLTPRSQQLLTEVLKPLLALIEGLCNSIAGTSAVTKLQ